MTSGLQRLGWVDPEEDDLSGTYVIIIWVVTLFATLSVVSGLKVGIKSLSILGFVLGCLILFLCFVMEKSYYLLDLLVQTTGFYLQWSIFQVSFWTDAFAALEPGQGRAVDGKAGGSQWIGTWTVFYMAWWVSWTCFVGIFIVSIGPELVLFVMNEQFITQHTLLPIASLFSFVGAYIQEQIDSKCCCRSVYCSNCLCACLVFCYGRHWPSSI